MRRGFQAPTSSDSDPLAVQEAQRLVLGACRALPSEETALEHVLGRFLAEQILAPFDLPPWDNSAMDGYAVRSVDLDALRSTEAIVLPVVFDVAAGGGVEKTLPPRTAARIMTGAPIPPGCDAVVPVEWTDGGLPQVTIRKRPAVGENIRHRGEEVEEGAVVLKAGRRAGPAELAILASFGRTTVQVGRAPEVALFATGSELVEPGQVRAPGQIVNSNSTALAALIRQEGARARSLGIVADEADAVKEALDRALAEADVVVSSGGVSVGAFDFVRECVGALGGQVVFWRVAMKPGKPILFATFGEKLFFGLPGNPASAMVGFHLFVAPALRSMSGATAPLPAIVHAKATSPIKVNGDRDTYVRVMLRSEGGDLRATPLPRQGSGALTSMAGANGLAHIDKGRKRVAAGDQVPVVLIGRIEE